MRNRWLAAALGAGMLAGLARPAAAADASLTVTVSNGDDTQGDVRVQLRPHGQHDGDVVAYGGSGDAMTLAAGTYDLEVTFTDGAASKVIWFDGVALSGHMEKTVDVALPVAALHLTITNGGRDIGDSGTFEVRPTGHHDADVIASARSGGTVRLAAGTYDIDVRFVDGAVDKTMWLDHVALSGSVDKAVEVGAAIADLRWHIRDHGQDVGDAGKFEIRPDGQHAGDVIAWGNSGGTTRLPAGSYTIGITYLRGMIHKVVWLDHQSLQGTMEQSTDLQLNLAQPTLSATLNGADVGDKARIGIASAGEEAEIGWVHGGETAALEAGRYDLTASMPGAEGVLAGTAIDGQPHLVVAMQPLQTEALQPGGPPPKACTIEVYGVNFDFDKAMLRLDAEPVLRGVLRLFTATPSFRAEVGGHTDNVGQPDYNMRLSDARAVAVKAWLVAHGVAAERVTARGYGDTRPLVANDTDADRFKNRRVELRRQNCQ